MTEQQVTVAQSTEVSKLDDNTIFGLMTNGDVSQLKSGQKIDYYMHLCKSLGLNPATKPFQIIKFQGKEIMYATKDCTEQLRKIHGVSICELDKLFQDGLYIVTAKAQDKNGRYDAATGAINIANLKGDALANAIMKCESKAKRRVTLSICGLGMLDESETDTLGNYQKIDVKTGEIIQSTDNTVAPKASEDTEIIMNDFKDSIKNCKTYDELVSAFKDAKKWAEDVSGTNNFNGRIKFIEEITELCKESPVSTRK